MIDTDGIRPFRIDVPQAELDDLRDRLSRTRWPRDPGATGWERGIPQGSLRPLAEHWREGFDWRAQAARLNELPQFTTTVDGQTIHFAHLRSAVPGARPLLLLHGWPSSFAEFLDLVGPLTDPVGHGGRAEDAFHLVVPSLPGYGFSEWSGEGWGDLGRVAGALAEVMSRLGYDRFLAHGTDAGSGIVGLLPMVAPGRVIATHVTGPSPFPLGPAIPLDGLEGADRARAERFNAFREDGTGYLHLQSTRPQTLGYGLTDSPVAQLAWIAEKFAEWTDGGMAAVDVDRLLTTASIFWFAQAGWSSAQALFEGMQVYRRFAQTAAGGDGVGGWEPPPTPPAAASVFAGDHSVRSVVDPAGVFATWVEHDRGGHFPAVETPDLLVGDLRAAFEGRR